MAKPKYHLHLKGYVGGWDFDSDYVDYMVDKYKDEELNVLIDSTGGYVGTALSVAAAFRRHGNVNVHFVGLNASAATLASLGAKHISIDKAAMYLVHKCSTYFFEWGSKNADQYEQLIKDVTKVKEDLDKFDLNAAQQYASRCKRKPEDMLALMARGGWLTAQEALEWGFVDEITNLEEDEKSLEVTEALVEAMVSHGLPLPHNMEFSGKDKNTVFHSLMKMLGNAFKRKENAGSPEDSSEPLEESANGAEDQITADETNNKNLNISMKNFAMLCGILALESIAIAENKASLSENQLQMIEDALAGKAKEIEDQKAENEALKAKLDEKPADTTKQVVDTKNPSKTEEKSDVENFVDTYNSAKELYDSLG